MERGNGKTRNGEKIGKLSLLILAYKDDKGKAKACLLRLHKFSSLPKTLLKFLVGNTKFVGNNVGGDISKIGRDYMCAEAMKKVTKVNLGQFARNISENFKFANQRSRIMRYRKDKIDYELMNLRFAKATN